ncbi:MAG: ATP-binding protein [Ignavibacteriae bacterium]|nr:ATP-binding protein [Ignavibacteriota bacterium]MCB9249503.1 ATP-binding protein [Ignavibacteriales bacterium]
MKRYLYDQILKDLERKMVFITGPRQVGKTYLSKQIAQEFSKSQYLNFDNMNERKIINEMTWKKNIDLLILDEIHKKMDWKLFLKGIFDSRQENLRILVTGSARLETFRQSGESLAGRYLHLRLNPFSVKELSGELSTYETIEKLNKIGGFPEPLLYSLNENEDESIEFAARWSKQYYIDLIREDIIEFSRIHEISAMKLLVELLRSKVGSPISYKNIAEDLEVSPNTIKKYIKILESLYIVFLVHPYHKNIARAILKEPKVYFYDTSFVKGNEGILFENTCAVSLLKNVQYLFDARGKEIGLHYLRTKEGKEIDFLISKNGKPEQFLEVKLSESKPSNSLKYFAERFENTEFIQLVHNLNNEQDINKIKIRKAGEWLANLEA